MTNLKVPISGEHWHENRDRALDVFRNHRNFLFSAYPDADALGTMLSLALYLRMLGKKATLFLPGLLKKNLEFIREIIQYNGIPVVANEAELTALQGEVDTLVFCDTAHAHLVPLFSTLQACFLSRGVTTVEIDHHFGTDSAAITETGIHLFRQANASTEIAAELLQDLSRLYPEIPSPFKQRNIVISLLMGLLTDTFGGRAVSWPRDYNYWYGLLGESLSEETQTPSRNSDEDEGAPLFRNPGELLSHINRLNPDQALSVEALKTKIVCHEGIGELNLLDSRLTELFREPIKSGNGEFFQIWNAMANVVPQVGGKVGLFYFDGKNAEGEDCIFLKIRRAFDFNQIDLRESEPALKNAFGEHYRGGGGHAGAVSFRIHPLREQEFRARVSGLVDTLQHQIQSE